MDVEATAGSEFTIKPIGIVHSPFTERKGTPIQPAFDQGTEATLEVFEEYADGLKDLEGFSHIYVIYIFNRADGYQLQCVPYRDTEARGVFACRAPKRPNQLGLSVVRLAERDGRMLTIADIDILDGTPVVDIKPYVPKFDAREDVRCGWLDQSDDVRHADERF